MVLVAGDCGGNYFFRSFQNQNFLKVGEKAAYKKKARDRNKQSSPANTNGGNVNACD